MRPTALLALLALAAPLPAAAATLDLSQPSTSRTLPGGGDLTLTTGGTAAKGAPLSLTLSPAAPTTLRFRDFDYTATTTAIATAAMRVTGEGTLRLIAEEGANRLAASKGDGWQCALFLGDPATLVFDGAEDASLTLAGHPAPRTAVRAPVQAATAASLRVRSGRLRLEAGLGDVASQATLFIAPATEHVRVTLEGGSLECHIRPAGETRLAAGDAYAPPLSPFAVAETSRGAFTQTGGTLVFGGSALPAAPTTLFAQNYRYPDRCVGQARQGVEGGVFDGWRAFSLPGLEGQTLGAACLTDAPDAPLTVGADGRLWVAAAQGVTLRYAAGEAPAARERAAAQVFGLWRMTDAGLAVADHAFGVAGLGVGADGLTLTASLRIADDTAGIGATRTAHLRVLRAQGDAAGEVVFPASGEGAGEVTLTRGADGSWRSAPIPVGGPPAGAGPMAYAVEAHAAEP